MSTIPFSDITLIAAALGIFFLIVAFYKSIFHKRKAPHKTTVPVPKKNMTAPAGDDQPVKLADPFQQVPVDSISEHKNAPQKPAASFYPAYPAAAESAAVSAFRQFNPHKDFAPSPATSAKNETSYEWE
ncbi:MAG: hypothetical protein PHU80_07030 [Kiritimatiellae bacterium]|nr:hypothetical protein [Kiritimatiellia bacterium]